MKERVIKIDDVEIIDAPGRRSGSSASHHAANHDVDRARPFGQILRLLLHLLVASLSVIIVVALSIGQVLGAVLRRTQKSLADRDHVQTANSKSMASDGAKTTRGRY